MRPPRPTFVVRALCVVLVAALCVSVAACGGGDDSSTTDSAPPSTVADEPVAPPVLRRPATVSADTHGLSATLEQHRTDEVQHEITLKMENHGDEVVRIETLRLDWAGMQPGEPHPLDYPVSPNTRVDLGIPLTDSVCSSPPQVEEAVPVAPIAATAETPFGEITFPVTDPRQILERVYPRDCERQAVEHAVTFQMDDAWVDASADPPTMTSMLTVTRVSSSLPIAVDAIHGSVVINVDLAEGPAVLGPDQSSMELPLVATNNRCDSHALAETRQPYKFIIDLRIGDELLPYLLSPGEDGQDLLGQGIMGRCPPDDTP